MQRKPSLKEGLWGMGIRLLAWFETSLTVGAPILWRLVQEGARARRLWEWRGVGRWVSRLRSCLASLLTPFSGFALGTWGWPEVCQKLCTNNLHSNYPACERKFKLAIVNPREILVSVLARKSPNHPYSGSSATATRSSLWRIQPLSDSSRLSEVSIKL